MRLWSKNEKRREKAQELAMRIGQMIDDTDPFDGVDSWADGGSWADGMTAIVTQTASDLLAGDKDWIIDSLEEWLEYAEAIEDRDLCKEYKKLLAEVKRFRWR